MLTPNWNDDNELMEDLGRALAPDRVDERILEAGRGAFAWRTVDADLALAGLSYDSRLDHAAVRGGPADPHRTLAFGNDDLSVEIGIGDAGMQGQLIPPGHGIVTVRTPDGVHAVVTADEVGCFELTPCPRGPVRLECAVGAVRIATEWITL